jgi:PKD repeat protein
MNRLITLLILSLASVASGANWYMRTNDIGNAGGTAWTNAWSVSDFNSHQSSISPGDTVWLAGGTYTTGITETQNGTSGSRIYIKRVLATDSTPTSSPGWSSSFDAQVVINIASTSGNVSINVQGSYVTVDGRVFSGGICNVPYYDTVANGGNRVYGIAFSGCSNSVVENVETYGPGITHNFMAYTIGLFSGGFGGNVVSNCFVHDFVQLVTIYNDLGTMVDHSVLANCGNGTNGSVPAHSNLIEYDGSVNLVLRDCVVSNWQVVGIMMWKGSELANVSGAIYIDGNIFKDAAQDLIWASRTGGDNKGPVYFYNNTLINCVASEGRGDSTSTAVLDASSQARNNIYWGSSYWSGPWHPAPGTSDAGVIDDRDYEFAATVLQAGYPSGTHCITNGTLPFVNYTGGNYNIVSNISSTYPRNKGTSIANTNSQIYNLDTVGTTRGADGAWDIGAYEYASGGGTAPTASFTTTPQGGTSPLTVAFVDTTTGSPTYEIFTFGDGGSTNTATCSHVYSVGTNTAILIATNSYGASTNSITITVTNGVFPPPPTHLWITPMTNALGTSQVYGDGSITNPYYGDFDYILNNIPTNSTINLLAGVFYTKGNEYESGDPWLSQNQHLIGAGTNVTIIRRDQSFHFQDAQNVAMFGTADGITVSNLTIDCNNTTGTNLYKGDGIHLGGNNCSIQMVQVINASGNLSQGQESFPILIGNGGGTNVLTTNNVIEHCEVSSIQGDYTTSISILGQATIRFCNVISTNPALASGYQASGTSNSLIISNSCIGAANGFYHDTYSNTNLTIAYNTFQCRKGIYFSEGTGCFANGLNIIGNNITLLPNSGNPGEVNGIELSNSDTNTQFRHITIAGNTISGANSGFLMRLYDSSYVTNVNNILWTTNVGLSSYYMIYMLGCSNTVTANNLILGSGGNIVGIYISDLQARSDSVLNNEIIGCNGSSLSFPMQSAISVCDSNLFFPFTNSTPYTLAQWRSLGFDSNSIVSDPLQFNHGSGKFTLTVSSPARNAAANLTSIGITTDVNGAVRPPAGNWDIGPNQSFFTPSTIYGSIKISGGSLNIQ